MVCRRGAGGGGGVYALMELLGWWVLVLWDVVIIGGIFLFSALAIGVA